MTIARTSQLVAETLSQDASPDARLTQIVVEALSGDPQPARVSQVVVEVLRRNALYECPFAAAGPSLCGQDVVLTWIEQTQNVIGSPEWVERVVSDIALNDPSTYYSGKKEPRVLAFGDITRRLSDVQGQWQGAVMTWREAELDRVLRNRLLDSGTRALTNALIICRMITYTDWVAKNPARTMFLGYGTRLVPAEDRSTELEAADALGKGIESGEITCPRRLFSPLYLPGLPADLIGTPEPIIYGHLTGALSSVTPPVLTGDAARGAYVDGGTQVFGYGDLPDPPTAPSNVTLTEVVGAGDIDLGEGPSGGETYYAFVTSVDANGDESDPDAFAQRDTGSVASVTLATGGSPGSAIQVTWDGTITAVAYRVYLGWNYYGVRVVQRIEVPAGSPLEATFDNCPTYAEWILDDWSQVATGAVRNPYQFFAEWAVSAVVAGEETALSAVGTARADGYRRPIHVEWEEVSGATEYRVYRRAYAGSPWDRRWDVTVVGSPPAGSPPVYSFDDDLLDTGVTYVADGPTPRGLVPVIYTGQEVLTATGETWYRFVVCGHAVAAIEEWYLDGVLEDVGTAGVDYLIPGQTGWDTRFGTPTYRDFNGRRYTVIYARGPKGDALAGFSGSPFVSGAASSVLTLNVRGIENSTSADGSGGLISDVHDQFAHWLINFALQDYQTGDWLPAPTWLPIATHCKINLDSFSAAKAYAASVVSGGYVGAGYLAEALPLRDWIARWCQSCDVRIGQNASGQWTVVRQVPDGAAVPLRTYTEVRHVQAGSVVLEPLYDEHWNEIPYTYRLDPATQTWEVAATVSDATSQSLYGEIRTAPTVALYFIRSADVATDILARLLIRHADPPLRVVFDTIDLCGTLTELGDTIGLTHTAGPGTPTGWVNVSLFCEGVVVHPTEARTTLECRALVAPHLES